MADVEDQLKVAQRLNDELRRLEMGEKADAPAAYEEVYKAGAARFGPAPGKQTKGPLKESKRTFTSAPKVHQAKKHVPAHYTFSSTRVSEIERENEVLAEKLARVVMRPAGQKPEAVEEMAGVPTHLKVASVAPSSINRRRKNDQIAKENAALLARLHSVRPSKDLKATRGGTTGRPVSSKPATTTLPKMPQKTVPVRFRPEWQE